MHDCNVSLPIQPLSLSNTMGTHILIQARDKLIPLKFFDNSWLYNRRYFSQIREDNLGGICRFDVILWTIRRNFTFSGKEPGPGQHPDDVDREQVHSPGRNNQNVCTLVSHSFQCQESPDVLESQVAQFYSYKSNLGWLWWTRDTSWPSSGEFKNNSFYQGLAFSVEQCDKNG